MGRWKIKKSKDEQFYFTLSASNGEVILTSEMYTTKENAYKGIDAIRENVDSLIWEDITESETIEDDTHKD